MLVMRRAACIQKHSAAFELLQVVQCSMEVGVKQETQ